jgi:hypothetical protein
MRSRTAETYGAAAHLWNALYDAPPHDPNSEHRRQARLRDIDFALRSMLLTCPASDRLRDLVEQFGQAALERRRDEAPG